MSMKRKWAEGSRHPEDSEPLFPRNGAPAEFDEADNNAFEDERYEIEDEEEAPRRRLFERIPPKYRKTVLFLALIFLVILVGALAGTLAASHQAKTVPWAIESRERTTKDLDATEKYQEDKEKKEKDNPKEAEEESAEVVEEDTTSRFGTGTRRPTSEWTIPTTTQFATAAPATRSATTRAVTQAPQTTSRAVSRSVITRTVATRTAAHTAASGSAGGRSPFEPTPN